MASGQLRFAGCPVRWWSAGQDGPVLLLMHGGGAHSGWWERTLEALNPRQRVVLFDRSGHGESGHRSSYSFAGWADETAAVIERAIGEPAILVCHSQAGRHGVLTAARRPDLVRSLVLVDSIIPTHDHEPIPTNVRLRIYPDEESAVSRFRLAPATDDVAPAILRRLGRQSVVRGADGWSWKFDPLIFDAEGAEEINPALADVTCPVVAIIGERSPVTDPSLLDLLSDGLGRPLAAGVVVPGADHHFMVDQPEVMARLIEELAVTSAPATSSAAEPRASRSR